MSNDWNIEESNYFLGTFDEATPHPKYDFLIRVSGSTVEDIEYYITGTKGFKSHFGNIFNYYRFVKDTLIEVILSQKRSLDYNGFYNAFLMGQLSEKEFVKIAKTFTYRPKTADIKILSAKINILYNLTQLDYTTSELADIFQCNINDMTAAIQSITVNKSLREPQ